MDGSVVVVQRVALGILKPHDLEVACLDACRASFMSDRNRFP